MASTRSFRYLFECPSKLLKSCSSSQGWHVNMFELKIMFDLTGGQLSADICVLADKAVRRKWEEDFSKTYLSPVLKVSWKFTTCDFITRTSYSTDNTWFYFKSVLEQICFLAHPSESPSELFWSPVVRRLVVRPSVNFSHFYLLLQNHKANFNQTWHKVSPGVGNSN